MISLLDGYTIYSTSPQIYMDIVTRLPIEYIVPNRLRQSAETNLQKTSNDNIHNY